MSSLVLYPIPLNLHELGIISLNGNTTPSFITSNPFLIPSTAINCFFTITVLSTKSLASPSINVIVILHLC